MIRRPPRSTRTDSFPTRRSSDLFWAFMSDPANAKVATGASETADYRLREDTLALNGTIYYSVGKFKILAGLRYEYTDDVTDTSQLVRSEEHTSELQSLMRISYAVFCLKKKKQTTTYKV